MRKQGSVRFEPYYKVQYFDDRPTMRVWVDVQRAHPTPEAARAAYLKTKRCRVMRIDERGRAPLDD